MTTTDFKMGIFRPKHGKDPVCHPADPSVVYLQRKPPP